VVPTKTAWNNLEVSYPGPVQCRLETVQAIQQTNARGGFLRVPILGDVFVNELLDSIQVGLETKAKAVDLHACTMTGF
jgi:hypothetical protein